MLILPPSETTILETGLKQYKILVKKGQYLNLTCYATVGCNDINYDIFFLTNSSDAYDIKMNVPDRSKCLINFNEITNFTKSILFNSFNTNATRVQCGIRFDQFKVDSPEYFVYFSDAPVLSHDKFKPPIKIDYDAIVDASSTIAIDVYFEASEDYIIEWYHEDKKLVDGEDTKFTMNCFNLDLFDRRCTLHIDPYTNKDVGEYSARVHLKSNPEQKFQLDVKAILPSKKYFCKFIHYFWYQEFNLRFILYSYIIIIQKFVDLLEFISSS